MKLNFKMSELIKSDTAKRKGINNMPDINSLNNMLELIVNCLQPVRNLLAKPMIITSGYRCKDLNKAVGGSSTSHHTKGLAVDFIIKGMSVENIVNIISKSDLAWTQLIEEHSGNSEWVHISYDKNNLKKEILLYKNGKYTKA